MDGVVAFWPISTNDHGMGLKKMKCSPKQETHHLMDLAFIRSNKSIYIMECYNMVK